MKWTPEGLHPRAQFGRAVDCSGRRIIGGAHSYDVPGKANVGTAFILDLDTGAETQLLAEDGEAQDQFGISVAIDRDIAAVGAFAADDVAGAVYIFEHTGGEVWEQTAKFTPGIQLPDEAHLGEHVATSDDVVVGSAGGNHRDGTVPERAVAYAKLPAQGPTPPTEEAVQQLADQIIDMIVHVISHRTGGSVVGARDLRDESEEEYEAIALSLARGFLT